MIVALQYAIMKDEHSIIEGRVEVLMHHFN